MNSYLTISCALLVLLHCACAAPHDVKVTTIRHDELLEPRSRMSPGEVVTARARRAAPQPVEGAPSRMVQTDDPVVQEATKVAVAGMGGLKGPIRVVSATKQVGGLYTIEFQAGTLPDVIQCTVKVLDDQASHTLRFDVKSHTCVA